LSSAKRYLRKVGRQRELTRFISRDFYKKFTSRYDGLERKFQKVISREPNQRREDLHGDKSSKRGDEDDKSSREQIPTVNVISSGLASGGDTKQARRSYQYQSKFLSVMNVEKKRPRSEETISFSEKDRDDVEGPHDDTIVLS
jgi:hypothetical protein